MTVGLKRVVSSHSSTVICSAFPRRNRCEILIAVSAEGDCQQPVRLNSNGVRTTPASVIRISSIGLLAFLSLMSAKAGQEIIRKELGKAEIGARTVSTVDVREIVFQPGQKTGLHRHPCPVISYIVAGTIKFQIRGSEIRRSSMPDRSAMSRRTRSSITSTMLPSTRSRSSFLTICSMARRI